jgi:hypothetical protein
MADEIAPQQLNLDQFDDVEDALQKLSDSRIYENEIKEFIEQFSPEWSLPLMFAQSAASRLRAFHEGSLREIAAENPHAAFTLNRSLAETVLVLAWTMDHPDYMDQVLRPKSELPKAMKPPAIVVMREHFAADAPGFDAVYADLCEVTHFGSKSFAHPHQFVDEGANEQAIQWAAVPRWRSNQEPLIACAQLQELRDAGVTLLHNFLGRHVPRQARP